MQFLLNKNTHPIDLQTLDINTTVLGFLRTHGWVGSKEGCASGDCGACTAVVIELCPSQQTLVFKSINTCITLVHSLAGKCLVTVEGLAEGKHLHPVQQAMIDCHGSQCGYCTPGFIMSMYAWFVNKKPDELIDDEEIEHALGGNLCRCTGYKPIIDSIHQAMKVKASYQDKYHNDETLSILQSFNKQIQQVEQNSSHEDSLSTNTSTQFVTPKNIKELNQSISTYPEAEILAGGTDLVLGLTLHRKPFTQLISIKNIAELSQIEHHADEVVISAGVSLNQALPILIEHFPTSKEYLYRFAAMQIRHWATVCGNIANASPIGDLAPMLLALEARLVLNQDNKQREIPLRDFFLSYKKTDLREGEWIQAVIIPKLEEHEKLYVYKLSKRFEDDISAVSMAMKITSTTHSAFNIAFGGMAEIPKLATKLMHELNTQSQDEAMSDMTDDKVMALSPHIMHALEEEFSPLSDMRASASYRSQMSSSLVKRALLQHLGYSHISVFEK